MDLRAKQEDPDSYQLILFEVLPTMIQSYCQSLHKQVRILRAGHDHRNIDLAPRTSCSGVATTLENTETSSATDRRLQDITEMMEGTALCIWLPPRTCSYLHRIIHTLKQHTLPIDPSSLHI